MSSLQCYWNLNSLNQRGRMHLFLKCDQHEIKKKIKNNNSGAPIKYGTCFSCRG